MGTFGQAPDALIPWDKLVFGTPYTSDDISRQRLDRNVLLRLQQLRCGVFES